MSIKNIGALGLLLCFCSASSWAQALIISDVVDGDIWQTTIVLTNTTAASAKASLSFFVETTAPTTQPWNLPFLEVSSTSSIALAAGQTLLLHTPGTAAVLSQGWGQLVADSGVVAYAIFTKRPAGLPAQVGTSPAAASASGILVPFDNTNGNVAAVALANPSSASETISVNIRTTGGTITQGTPLTIPAQGHMTFTLPQQFTATAGQSGLAEFYTSSGTISMLALSFNPAGSLTTAPVYPETAPIIAGGSSGGTSPYSSFLLTSALLFQPVGLTSGNVSLSLALNADGTWTATINSGSPIFTNGTFTDGGLTFTANALQANVDSPPYGLFLAPGANFFQVSSASLTFNLTPTSTLSDSQEGSLAGTLTVIGTLYPQGGAAVAISGAISGTYYAQLTT
jgi:hypothetical protein